jgi:type I restriction enzyme S subunit
MKNWEKKKLGEVCIVERGSSPRPIEKYQTDSPDGVNWIKIGDTKGVDKYIFSTREKITKEGAEKSRYVKEGDFILSNSMSFGKPYIMKTDGYIHDGWFVFRLPDYIDKDYFYHLLTSPNVQEQIQSLGAGAIVKNISGDLVKRVDVTYPKSLPEQQRIVAILDEAFAAITKAKANAEQNLKNAKELFESYLQGVFEKKGEGWEEKILDEVCEFRNGAAHEQHINDDGKYVLINSKFISSDGEKCKRTNSALSPLFVGVIAFVMSDVPNGKALAKCFLVDQNDTYTLNQRIGAIKSKVFVPEFLVYQFNRNKYLLSFNNGENQTNLRKGDILKCPLFVPSKEEQQTIVHQLDALRAETQKLEAVYQKKIADLEELKKSILQKAFAGELKTEKLQTV